MPLLVARLRSSGLLGVPFYFGYHVLILSPSVFYQLKLVLECLLDSILTFHTLSFCIIYGIWHIFV